MAITFPAGPHTDGDIFTNTTTGVKYIYNAADDVWKTHVWPTNTDYLQLSGGTLTGDLSLGTNDLTAQDITTTGSVTVGNGLTVSDGNIVMASGHGIDFSATADGSGTTTSELLDDYEEGTWTPTNGVGTGSFDANTWGRYTKIGHRVWLSCYVSINSIDDTTSAFQVSGIPFTVVDPGTGGFIGTVMSENTNWGTNTKTQLVPYTSDTLNGIRLYGAQNDTSWEPVDNIDVAAGDAFYMSISYEVA